MKRLQALARRVSNWGRWGPDDERGTVNFITPEVVRRGAACVKRGAERLRPGEVIGPDALEVAERAEGVRAGSGDVLLVRTGHLAVFTRDGDREGYMRQMPGLGIACVEWLHAREVAAVASDTSAVEVIPFEDPAVPLPVHALCIRDMGLTLGEMFDLDELAADSARDGVWECLFSAPPLKVAGGIGSPLNPLAVK